MLYMVTTLSLVTMGGGNKVVGSCVEGGRGVRRGQVLGSVERFIVPKKRETLTGQPIFINEATKVTCSHTKLHGPFQLTHCSSFI